MSRLFHGRSPPQLLTAAAHGCLEPSPASRLRRTYLHLLYSMRLLRFLDTSRPVHLWGSPLDYGPVLLRRPFGFPSRWTPCPPETCRRWLQVHLGCIRLSLSCPCRLLHTFLLLRPARNDPRFWI